MRRLVAATIPQRHNEALRSPLKKAHSEQGHMKVIHWAE